MAKNRVPTLTFMLLLILLVGASTAVATPAVLYVDNVDDGEGGNFSTIQEAVNAAVSGDTILVYPGEYVENVDVNKELIIRSSSGNPEDTAVAADYSGDHVFEITANNVTISGFNITGSGYGSYYWDYYAGIYLDQVENNTISNNCLENNYNGIHLYYSDGNKVTDNTVNMTDEYGIYLEDSSDNILTGNEVKQTDYYGVFLIYAERNYLAENNISYNSYHGLHMEYCDNNTVENNIVTFNGDDDEENGIHMCGYNNTISGNNVSYNGWMGIRLGYDSYENRITGNTVIGNGGHGIRILYADYNDISGNTVDSNGRHGILLDGHDNTVAENEITGNLYHGVRVGGYYGWDYNYNNSLVDNTITYNGYEEEYGDIYHGIRLDGYNNTLEGNIVSFNAGHGIRIEEGYENHLIGNTVSSNGYGGIRIGEDCGPGLEERIVRAKESFRNLKENLATLLSTEESEKTTGCSKKLEGLNRPKPLKAPSEVVGVSMTNNTLINNTVTSNGANGISLSYSTGDTLEDNEVSSNGYSEDFSSTAGINLAYCLDTTLAGNTLEDNTYVGLYLEESPRTTVCNNYFNNKNNTEFAEVTLVGGLLGESDANVWNSTLTEGSNIVGGPYIGGNFWATPEGDGFSQTAVDADEDGICDAAYNVTEDGKNVDYYPLIKLPEPEPEPEPAPVKSSSRSSPTYIPAPTGDNAGPVDSAQKKVVAGQESSVQFPDPENGVLGVGFKSSGYSGMVIVRVEGADGENEGSNKLNGKVYRHVNILVGNERFEENIDQGYIEFRVPKSWAEENNIDPATITLNRYHGEAWNPLSTEMTAEDEEFYYFRAETPGFSLYAITGEEKSSGAAEETEVITPSEDEETENVTGEEQTKPDEGEKESTPGFESIFAALGILGSAFLGRKEMFK